MTTALTTGQWIVLGIFAAGLACSLTLLIWLVKSLRRERRLNGRKPDASAVESGHTGRPVQHQ